MKLLPVDKRNLHCAFCGTPHSKYLVKFEGQEVISCNRCVLKEFERMKEDYKFEN